MKRLVVAAVLVSSPALAGSFDAQGRHLADPDASVFESFEGAVEPNCEDGCTFEVVSAGAEQALDGTHWLSITTQQESFDLDLPMPSEDAAYRFRVWVRHARAWVRATFEYSSSRDTEHAYLFPTGRVTSDGWVELASNAVSVTGSELSRTYLRVESSNVEIDAVEVVSEGDYDGGSACLGAFDPVCGPEAVCIAERCRQGARYVPPLPAAQHRDSVARYLASRVQHFFGGRKSRVEHMPAALLEMQKMRVAATPWQFWSAFARGVNLLSDWHTAAHSGIESHGSRRRFGVCFIEGTADLTQQAWPSQAGSADVLVSHVGPEQNLGLVPGDRLVAVDGQHPLDWARSLASVRWSLHQATDRDVDAELAEAMRGLIPAFAKTFTVLRCDPAQKTCSSTLETLSITDIPESDAALPSCDNRPAYHLQNPPEDSPGSITTYHHVPFFPWRDLVVDSQPGENIYGMTWDNLYGTAQGLTPLFLQANEVFKQEARGVILDHRAGNGGTIDAPQALTQLVRTPEKLSVGPLFTMVAGENWPATPEEGIALFDRIKTIDIRLYEVGSASADLDLPVALLIHRDGSASDWLPHGMKGAPKVRIFGPHETAGAFSSFYNFSYWSRLDFQMASGETVTFDGQTLIGHGVEPDEVVVHTQSALLEGRDLPYEAALEWVRANLK